MMEVQEALEQLAQAVKESEVYGNTADRASGSTMPVI